MSSNPPSKLPVKFRKDFSHWQKESKGTSAKLEVSHEQLHFGIVRVPFTLYASAYMHKLAWMNVQSTASFGLTSMPKEAGDPGKQEKNRHHSLLHLNSKTGSAHLSAAVVGLV